MDFFIFIKNKYASVITGNCRMYEMGAMGR